MEHRDLNDLAVFAAIAQTGTITGAAKKLHLPKSNVSRRLARLEARLGVQLVERNTRSSRLTPIGGEYASYCRLMVEEANAADAIIEASLAEPSGELRVSASVLVGQQIIAPAIAAYVRQYPKVQVVLELTNARVNLIEEGFDLAFRIGENQDAGLISQAIGSFWLKLYASPDYLSVAGTPKSPADLMAHQCLVVSNEIRATGWMLKQNEEVSEIKVPSSAVINDFLTLRNLAIAGGGIAMLPTYAVRAECASGRLAEVLPKWSSTNAKLSALYPSRRGATVKQRAFIESVRSIAESLV